MNQRHTSFTGTKWQKTHLRTSGKQYYCHSGKYQQDLTLTRESYKKQISQLYFFSFFGPLIQVKSGPYTRCQNLLDFVHSTI
jgi:hypothetical protein